MLMVYFYTYRSVPQLSGIFIPAIIRLNNIISVEKRDVIKKLQPFRGRLRNAVLN